MSIEEQQIEKCLTLLIQYFKNDMLGLYLYGSSIVGGRQKYSDLDLFVVCNRATTYEEKRKLIKALLTISSTDMPIELTIVSKDEINPWRYPPRFDFQYGEWLRRDFEKEDIELSHSFEMPDLALLITQVLLASKTLVGESPDALLCKVPYKDFMKALLDALPHLLADIENDTRNVLLTLARIWTTAETDSICSKPQAAAWAIEHLADQYAQVLKRASAICLGEEKEHWEDIQEHILPCAQYMLAKIEPKLYENIANPGSAISIARY